MGIMAAAGSIAGPPQCNERIAGNRRGAGSRGFAVRGPPGRLQCVSTEPRVLVDFAHTDGALHAVLESLRGLASPEQRILLVIGCGGDRDHTKRPRMAAVAAEGAHEVWLTSDNPRSEDPAAILRDMAAGIPDIPYFTVYYDMVS